MFVQVRDSMGRGKASERHVFDWASNSGSTGDRKTRLIQGKQSGTPERIRTSDTRLRRPVLYPTELRAYLRGGFTPIFLQHFPR